MKKISLKDLNLKEVEQLSRDELKNVLGGWTGGTTDTTSGNVCEDPNENGKFEVCYNCCLIYLNENTYPGEYDDDYNPETICSDGC
jgi:natural product precursor